MKFIDEKSYNWTLIFKNISLSELRSMDLTLSKYGKELIDEILFV